MLQAMLLLRIFAQATSRYTYLCIKQQIAVMRMYLQVQLCI